MHSNNEVIIMNKNKIIKLIISLIYVIFTIVFILKINSMNIIPNKYLLLYPIILVVLSFYLSIEKTNFKVFLSENMRK